MLVNLFNLKMPDPKEIDQALEKKFIGKEKFGEEIEKLKLRSNMNYIDCIVQYCEENSIELESVKKILPKALKEKLEYDAHQLNYLKKSSRAKLPL